MTSRASLRILQVVLGAVLFVFSMELVVAQLRAPHRGHAFWFFLLLGAAEALAALLFLVSVRKGGFALLVIFAAAAIFHLLHGQVSGLGSLAIYAASVLAVLANVKGG